MLISANLIPWDLGGRFETAAMRAGSINCQKRNSEGIMSLLPGKEHSTQKN